MGEKCPVCQGVFESLVRHLMSPDSKCLPSVEGDYPTTLWRTCWCGGGMLHPEVQKHDCQWLERHFDFYGGAKRHYIDCLLGGGREILR